MSRLLLALALALAPGCAHTRDFGAADHAAIVELLRAQQEAWNRGDLEAFLSAWDYTLMAFKKQPDEDLLLYLLDTQLRKCKALGPAFVVYDGAEE